MNELVLTERASTLQHLKFDAKLSDREFEICEQVILGYTQLESSQIFFRSFYTIAQTIRNAFTKTGARNISELGVWYWCKKFNATMVISDRKRKIITMVLLMFFLVHDLAPVKMTLREVREIETRAARRKGEEYNPNEYLLCL